MSEWVRILGALRRAVRGAPVHRFGGLVALILVALSTCGCQGARTGTVATLMITAAPNRTMATPGPGTPPSLTPRVTVTPPASSSSTLPAAALTPSVQPPYCGGGTSTGEPITYSSPAARTWASSQVIVGLVESQETRWEVSSGTPYIVTYSLLQVEGRARGQPAANLFVATPGGTLDGCTQRSNAPALQRGERYLLFLLDRESRPATRQGSIYLINGGEEGRQLIVGDTRPDALLAPLRQSLTQPPPPDLRADFVVPLARSPLAPVATPQP